MKAKVSLLTRPVMDMMPMSMRSRVRAAKGLC